MVDATNKDDRFEKLTPIVEYTYVVVYNLLNTMRSLKNYVQAYSRDMGLQEMEQYQSAIKAVEEAINGLTNSAKELGAIYGLPEDVLHPEKMLKGLGEQIQHMQERGELPDMTKLADKLAGANNQAVESQPATQAQLASAPVPPTPPEPKPAPQAPVPSTQPAQPQPESAKPETFGMQNTPTSAESTSGFANTTPASNAQASTNQSKSQSSQQPASQTNQQPANSPSAGNNASASSDDDEIKKILDQLKALRNNQ